MPKFIYLLLLVLLTSCAPTQSYVPTSEEGIKHEAELFIRLSLSDRLVERTKAYYKNQAISMLLGSGLTPQEAEKKVNMLMNNLADIEHQRLIEALVPIYLSYYTAEEIHQLLSFYQTEVARKSLLVSPQIAVESQKYVRLWDEHFGTELLQQIQSEQGGQQP